jgi:uncharacterized membrane protein YczE
LSFGLLEPSFLLLVLFSCMYTVHKHTSEPGSNPNLFIFALTVGLTLPMCAAQVFAALFSRWVCGSSSSSSNEITGQDGFRVQGSGVEG